MPAYDSGAGMYLDFSTHTKYNFCFGGHASIHLSHSTHALSLYLTHTKNRDVYSIMDP